MKKTDKAIINLVLNDGGWSVVDYDVEHTKGNNTISIPKQIFHPSSLTKRGSEQNQDNQVSAKNQSIFSSGQNQKSIQSPALQSTFPLISDKEEKIEIDAVSNIPPPKSKNSNHSSKRDAAKPPIQSQAPGTSSRHHGSSKSHHSAISGSAAPPIEKKDIFPFTDFNLKQRVQEQQQQKSKEERSPQKPIKNQGSGLMGLDNNSMQSENLLQSHPDNQHSHPDNGVSQKKDLGAFQSSEQIDQSLADHHIEVEESQNPHAASPDNKNSIAGSQSKQGALGGQGHIGLLVQQQNQQQNENFFSSAKQSEVYAIIIPSCAHWFRMDTINQIQKDGVPEFFLGKPSQSPQVYQQYRNYIITLFRQNPRLYLTATACRRNLAGDVCGIIRIHFFLEHWGLINFNVDPKTIPQSILTNQGNQNPNLAFQTDNAMKAIDLFDQEKEIYDQDNNEDHFLFKSAKMLSWSHRPACDFCGLRCGLVWFQQKATESQKIASQNVVTSPLGNQNSVLGGNNTSPGEPSSINNNNNSMGQSNMGNSEGSINGTGGNPSISQQPQGFTSQPSPVPPPPTTSAANEMALCVDCYLSKNFPNMMNERDFVQMDIISKMTADLPRTSSRPPWLPDQTLQLLDTLERNPKDWNELLSQLGNSRSREEVILQFLQLPLQNISFYGSKKFNEKPDERLGNIINIITKTENGVKVNEEAQEQEGEKINPLLVHVTIKRNQSVFQNFLPLLQLRVFDEIFKKDLEFERMNEQFKKMTMRKNDIKQEEEGRSLEEFLENTIKSNNDNSFQKMEQETKDEGKNRNSVEPQLEENSEKLSPFKLESNQIQESMVMVEEKQIKDATIIKPKVLQQQDDLKKPIFAETQKKVVQSSYVEDDKDFLQRLAFLKNIEPGEAAYLEKIEEKTSKRAFELQKKEENKIKLYVSQLIEIQLNKLQHKLNYLQEYEKFIQYEREQLDQHRKASIAEVLASSVRRNECAINEHKFHQSAGLHKLRSMHNSMSASQGPEAMVIESQIQKDNILGMLSQLDQ